MAKVEDFMEQAKAKYQEHVDFEIRKIARQLLEEYEEQERKKIEDNCPHIHTNTTNHGYHKYCSDCGAEL